MARAKRPASRCLAAAALVFAQTLCTCQANTVCRYGEEPGVWDRKTFQILDRDCQLVRYVDHIKGKAYQKEVAGEILFVGDSLNRNLILDVGNELEAPAVDYTPIPYDDRGRPEKIGRNAIMKLGTFTAANIFHFGAHEKENHWLGPARAGISGMHNSTYGRICLDAPRYLQKANVKKVPPHPQHPLHTRVVGLRAPDAPRPFRTLT